MISLEQIENSLLSATSENYPSTKKWDPPLSGDIDIVIKANGDWYHEGIRFTRQPLVKLFASILRKEGSDYYLVTPVEKWRIVVEVAPLLVIEMDVMKKTSDETQQVIQFKTYTDDVITLDKVHPIRLHYGNGEIKPLVHVHSGLHALIHRNIFYRMTDMVNTIDGTLGVWSQGSFHPLE